MPAAAGRAATAALATKAGEATSNASAETGSAGRGVATESTPVPATRVSTTDAACPGNGFRAVIDAAGGPTAVAA